MYEAIKEKDLDVKTYFNLNPTQEGREAYCAGYSLSDCPYQKDSPSEKAWFIGWAEEDMKFRERWRGKKLSSILANE